MYSPLPLKDGKLHDLLIAFYDTESIDLLPYKETIIAEDFTLDIIPTVDIKDLCQVTGFIKGHIYKLCEFAHKWLLSLAETWSCRLH